MGDFMGDFHTGHTRVLYYTPIDGLAVLVCLHFVNRLHPYLLPAFVNPPTPSTGNPGRTTKWLQTAICDRRRVKQGASRSM